MTTNATSTATKRVSILVPCWNESATIVGLLEGVLLQSHPTSHLEVLIADGGSEDGTRDLIRAFQDEHPELKIVLLDNPRRIIPAALNIAIAAATGDILLRLDGHSRPEGDYVESCLRLLEAGKGDMVGGRLDVKPRNHSWQALAVASAVSHPFGVGDAHFRFSNQEQEVDTIAFCAYARSWIDRIGLYDETLLTNEDYEFNSRLRKAGGRIWLDPSMKIVYYPPSTLSGLFRQYRRYGFWKGRMLRSNPSTLRWRHAMPPLAVWGGLGLLLGSLAAPVLLVVLGVLSALYLAVTLFLGRAAARTYGEISLVLGLPLAFLCAHGAWGFFVLVGWLVGPAQD